MNTTKIENHTATIVRFTEQWRSKPKLMALARALLRQVQDAEDATFEVLVDRQLDNATGAQLAVWGRLVDQANTFSTDDEFRNVIRSRLAIQRSDGTAESVLRVARVLLPPEAPLRLRDEPPAQMRLILGQFDAIDIQTIHDLLTQANAAGVRFIFQWDPHPAPNAYPLLLADSDTGPVTGSGGLNTTVGTVTNPGFLAGSTTTNP